MNQTEILETVQNLIDTKRITINSVKNNLLIKDDEACKILGNCWLEWRKLDVNSESPLNAANVLSYIEFGATTKYTIMRYSKAIIKGIALTGALAGLCFGVYSLVKHIRTQKEKTQKEKTQKRNEMTKIIIQEFDELRQINEMSKIINQECDELRQIFEAIEKKNEVVEEKINDNSKQ